MSETRTSPPAVAAPAASGSPFRLLLLLGLLAVVVGMYSYDYLVAAPESKKKYEEIQTFVEDRNSQGVENADLVRSKDIQELLGAPTFTKEQKDHTIEYYCWWGQTPLLNTRRSYISVLYDGAVPRRYRAHYLNEAPPAEDLPGYVPPPPPEGEVGADAMFGPGGPLDGGATETTEEPAEGTPPASTTEPAAEKPADDKPADDKPAEDKPAEEKPAEDKPAEEKPAEDKPADDKPAEDKPAEDKPAEEKPAEDKPAEDKPAEDKPAATDEASAAKSDE